jgi:DNA-directed RNA polymerase specialized sigma subunit
MTDSKGVPVPDTERDQAVQNFIDLVKPIARGIGSHFRLTKEDREDLVSCGNIGLLNAAAN